MDKHLLCACVGIRTGMMMVAIRIEQAQIHFYVAPVAALTDKG